ncbi:MAG: hypothetical protein D3909_06910 [Candidatus Electrothrix sp. ATG1]|nr:hypothetical protein [Candidatus Electrothrix sp. ATG1]
MKKIINMAVLAFLFFAGIAQATWIEEFTSDCSKFGVGIAVENALEDNISPAEILTFIVENSETFEVKKGLKALYCAGADREAVQEAANKLGITVDELSAALQESIQECGDKLSLSDRDLMDDEASAGGGSGLSDRDVGPPSPEPVAPAESDVSPEPVEPPQSVDPPNPTIPPLLPTASSPSTP